MPDECATHVKGARAVDGETGERTLGRSGSPRPISKRRRKRVVKTGVAYPGIDEAASGRNPRPGGAPAACFWPVETGGARVLRCGRKLTNRGAGMADCSTSQWGRSERGSNLPPQCSGAAAVGKERARGSRCSKCTPQHSNTDNTCCSRCHDINRRCPHRIPASVTPPSHSTFAAGSSQAHPTSNPRNRAAIEKIVGPSRHQRSKRWDISPLDRAVGGTRCPREAGG